MLRPTFMVSCSTFRGNRWLLLVLAFASLAVEAPAQRNSHLDLLDSPIKLDGEIHAVNEAIACSITLPGAPALYGLDTITGTAPIRMIVGELYPPFRVHGFDQNCSILSSWTTALPGSTQTGLAVPNGDPSSYWAIDPEVATATRFEIGVGTPTGVTIPLPRIGFSAAVVDDNQAGEVLCLTDIVRDTFVCIDAEANGAFLCSYANADNTGGGAFGNGIGDAISPSECSGQTLVQSSGTPAELQVTRVGQYDCTGMDPLCSDRWTIFPSLTFVNGIEEIPVGYSRGSLVIVANSLSSIFILQGLPVCAPSRSTLDCQGHDPDSDLLYVNGSLGRPFDYIELDANAPLSVALHRTSSGNGKFVAKMWAGWPNFSTCRRLFDLGYTCFDFLDDSASVVANNLGRTGKLGSSAYFGSTTEDPARAPTFVDSLMQPRIDAANLPSGSIWLLQSIHRNPASSSQRGASISNAIAAEVR